jgi:hypothetical protein
MVVRKSDSGRQEQIRGPPPPHPCQIIPDLNHKHADYSGTEVKTGALEGRSRRYAPKKEKPTT